jgi:hypothetical protein
MGAEGAVYRGGLTDSLRWAGFEFRPDDIVISAPSKCGTTWMQMIMALLIFQSPELPAPLSELSPWLDIRARTSADVRAQLDGQRHRRFIKTHTPLDGLPTASGVTFIVIGRDPRHVAVSMSRHRANLDGARIAALLERVEGPQPAAARVPRPTDPRERIMQWIEDDSDPRMASLRGTLWHLGGAWERRTDPSVQLVHYAELEADLDGQMRGIATLLGIEVPEASWTGLVAAARLDRMRSAADRTAPTEGIGLLLDPKAFFCGDSAQQWAALTTSSDREAYCRRVAKFAAPDLVDWLHRGKATGDGL